jgi:diguanylate cyclase (GGDEF)-like protein
VERDGQRDPAVRRYLSAMVAGRALRLYLAGSALILAAHPLLPAKAQPLAFLLVALGTIPAVARGLTAARPGRRAPWWVLLAALSVLNLGLIIRIVTRNEGAGESLNAIGNVLILVAAVALILRSGRADVNGVIDASIIGLSLGGVLCIWVLRLPNIINGAGRLDMFVVLFALSGVLGALVRIAVASPQPVGALQWLMLGLTLALAGNVLDAASGHRVPAEAADLLFMAAYTSVGAFGLHATAPLLVRSANIGRDEQLTSKRLVFLGAAMAVIPVTVGVLMLLDLASHRDGAVLLVAGTLTATVGMVRIARLSADRSRVERALRQQAAADPLTGLPNRRTLLGRLEGDLGRRRRCTVLFCDLDGFKAVNDRWGHGVGDELLTLVADRLVSSVRSTDTVSRFGGDEFVILLADASAARANAIIERIRAAFSAPFHLTAGELTLGVSVGVASSTAGTADDLVQAADIQMYRAKQTHGPTPSVRFTDAEQRTA